LKAARPRWIVAEIEKGGDGWFDRSGNARSAARL
jgi:hypothetical protein